METTYKATGIVLGNYWGGGQGSYRATPIGEKETLEEVIAEANAKLKDGSLDSGMGYESLIGALLTVTTTRTVFVDERRFTNEEIHEEFIGDLSARQVEFLEQVLLNN